MARAAFAIWEPASLRLTSGVPLEVLHRQSPIVAFACGIRTGSRNEDAATRGVTHLFEHLLLRTPLPTGEASLPRAIEALGGQVNAVTTKEDLAVYGRLPADAGDAALDLLAATVCDAPLAVEALEQEKRVVIEELRAAAADPADAIFDLMYEALFEGDPIAAPVAGDLRDVERLDADALTSFRSERVHAGTIGIAVVGPIDPDLVHSRLESGAFALLTTGAWAAASRPPRTVVDRERPRVRRIESKYTYVGFVGDGVAYRADDRAAAEILAMLLGGSSNSLLYRTIRDELGLAYLVAADHRPYTDTGIFRLLVGTTSENVSRVIDTVRALAEETLQRRVDTEELEIARRQCVAELLLGSEDSAELALWLLRNRLLDLGHQLAPEAHARALAAVEPDDVHAVAEKILRPGLIPVVAGGYGPWESV